MTNSGFEVNRTTDRTNGILAGVVFLVTFVVYALTVQRSFSFWDCGEFIASAVIMGIPHPPGTPLLIMICRIFSMLPFVEDISYRINYLSVISSSFTALFSYLIAVRLIRVFLDGKPDSPLNRLTVYAGGIAGGLFVAFSATNWANSVEAEAYGLALALSTAIFWLTMIYHERRNEPGASKIMMLAMYLAVLGIGVHMTVFLVVPVCAIFFILNRRAEPRDYAMICTFAVIELLLVILFANGRGGPGVFKFVSLVLGGVLFVMLYRKIRWGILVAIAATSSLMISFSLYFWALPSGVAVVILLALLARRFGWEVQWKTGLTLLLVGFLGFSVHFFVNVRSELNPRIDENNPSRDWQTFVDFLDRRQYGQVSMTDRMFERRGAWSNQFGRHPHMGFWSYFEEQYGGGGGWGFAPFFLLGLIGLLVAIRKRLELGLPFLTLILLGSVGLILYMNFADGTKYDFVTGDAYLEVRNRDYFFTPAFVFFGIAIGLGVAAVMRYVKDILSDSSVQRPVVYLASLLAFLPIISLADNYHSCDRSGNFLPIQYARNILDGCRPNSILFTGGDNDTFPVWCLQEAYNYRLDVRVVNLSLLNTDWYIEQMKNRYGVPISLTEEQILWYPYELPGGQMTRRPNERFADRPRQRLTYLHPQFSGIATQHMMVDEIVIENKWHVPIYFSAPPYAESPLKLREHAVADGQLYRLEREPDSGLVDLEHSYDLFMNTYRFDGLENAEVFRDDNATGVYAGLAMSSLRVFDELVQRGDRERAEALMNRFITAIPEFWQAYVSMAELYGRDGDTARALQTFRQLHDTLAGFLKSNPRNQFYMQDLGTAKIEIGLLTGDQDMIDEGVRLVWEGFEINLSSGLAFRKLFTVLRKAGRSSELIEATRLHAEYKRNRSDPLVQSVLGISAPPGAGALR